MYKCGTLFFLEWIVRKGSVKVKVEDMERVVNGSVVAVEHGLMVCEDIVMRVLVDAFWKVTTGVSLKDRNDLVSQCLEDMLE